MKNKINIAELLKDCPRGMELDCTIYDTKVTYQGLNKRIPTHPIVVRTEHGFEFELTQYGQTHNIVGSKCVIFPKGKTTWEGFVPPIKYKDGDVVISTSNNIHLISCRDKNNGWESCCGIVYGKFDSTKTAHVIPARLATKEEKQKLFQAIKDNGYKWDSENKILEKLTESKENTDDKVVMSGIYFNREDYADEVELHLNNYEIEIRDGRTYAIFKNQKTKTLEKSVKPIFRVGDTIQNKVDKWLANRTIKSFTEGIGYLTTINDCFTTTNDWICIEDQDNWELVPNKFDINTLVPFESRVLVREDKKDVWRPTFYGFFHQHSKRFYTTSCGTWLMCIPYNENTKHLTGTTNDCDNFYKTWEK